MPIAAYHELFIDNHFATCDYVLHIVALHVRMTMKEKAATKRAVALVIYGGLTRYKAAVVEKLSTSTVSRALARRGYRNTKPTAKRHDTPVKTGLVGVIEEVDKIKEMLDNLRSELVHNGNNQ